MSISDKQQLLDRLLSAESAEDLKPILASIIQSLPTDIDDDHLDELGNIAHGE